MIIDFQKNDTISTCYIDSKIKIEPQKICKYLSGKQKHKYVIPMANEGRHEVNFIDNIFTFCRMGVDIKKLHEDPFCNSNIYDSFPIVDSKKKTAAFSSILSYFHKDVVNDYVCVFIQTVHKPRIKLFSEISVKLYKQNASFLKLDISYKKELIYTLFLFGRRVSHQNLFEDHRYKNNDCYFLLRRLYDFSHHIGIVFFQKRIESQFVCNGFFNFEKYVDSKISKGHNRPTWPIRLKKTLF